MRNLIWAIACALFIWSGAAWAQATDRFSGYQSGLDSPATNASTVTPHDSNELGNVTRALWVGGAGDVVVVTVGGDTVTLVGVQAGTLLPIRVKIVKSTGTTATSMVALY